MPKTIEKIYVPPIKCRGIKTKLVRFIAENVYWNGEGKWVEPFLGSGVVLFNILPERALVTDTNIHIINFYKDLQSKNLDSKIVRDFLEEHGALLKERGKKYYYELRKKLECNFALSMWKENKYRVNEHLLKYWSGYTEKTFEHFYHVGSAENLRNKMIEALIVQNRFITEKNNNITFNTFYEDACRITKFNPV